MQHNNTDKSTASTQHHSYNMLDTTRAVLIMMVILVHIVHFGNLHATTKEVISSFLMPSFLVITGYLVNIDKPIKAFAKYLLRIFIPYTVMVVLFACASTVMPVRDGIDSITVSNLLRVVFVDSIGPYWFLHTMMVAGSAYYIAFSLFRRWHVALRMLLFALLLAAISLFTPLLPPLYAAYYLLGAVIKQSGCSYKVIFGPLSLLVSGVLVCVFALPHIEVAEWLQGLARVVCFLSFMTSIDSLIPSHTYAAAGYIGRNTFPIYLFHPVFTMAAKFYLPLFAFDSTALCHALFTIMLGVAGTLAIAKAMDATHLSRLFLRNRLLR